MHLYGLDPGEIVAARNELAKGTADRGIAEAIKAMRKPTLPAALANRLVRAVPDRVDRLTQLGEDLRQAHRAGAGDRLRELTPQRRELVRELVQTARRLSTDAGHPMTEAVAERLTETLDAALVDPGAAAMLRTGCLTSALRHVGFGVVDESGEPARIPPLKTAPAPSRPAKKPAAAAGRQKARDRLDERRRQELQERLDEMIAEHAAAEAARIAAESELDSHEHHLSDLEATIARLTEELENARATVKQLRSDTGRLERALARATRDAVGAAKRMEAARHRLEAFAS
jgi:hypothetical protein